MKNNWKEEFESKCESGHFKIGEIDKSLLIKFIESLLAEQKKELIEEWRPCLQEVLDSLAGMYNQYCYYGHGFMSSGERASYILEKYGEYKFDDAGRMTHYFEKTNKPNEKREGKFIEIKHHD